MRECVNVVMRVSRFHASTLPRFTVFRYFINFNIFLRRASISSKNEQYRAYPSLCAITPCVSSSDKEPSAIYRNWMNSFSPCRAAPSAIFDGTETAALLICEVSPYNSDAGNSEVALYTASTSAIPDCHICRSLCVFISYLGVR